MKREKGLGRGGDEVGQDFGGQCEISFGRLLKEEEREVGIAELLIFGGLRSNDWWLAS